MTVTKFEFQQSDECLSNTCWPFCFNHRHWFIILCRDWRKPKEMVGMPSNGIEANLDWHGIYPIDLGGMVMTSVLESHFFCHPSIQINIPILGYSCKNWYSRNLLAIQYSDGNVSVGWFQMRINDKCFLEHRLQYGFLYWYRLIIQ